VCGSRKAGERWIPSTAGRFLGKEDLQPFLKPLDGVGIRRIEWTEVDSAPGTRSYKGEALTRFRGVERNVPVAMTVHVDAITCPTCSRRAGHFYTAQIQLRGPEGRLSSGARQRRARLMSAWEAVLPEARSEWKKALSWGEEKPEGWDFFLSDTLAARNLAKLMKHRLGATLKESATLYGRKDGHDIYRVTICLRVPVPSERNRSPEEPAEDEGPVERHA
ncbi:MAG: 60S ribosomal export protein NMD3, partial [Thermoplasmata archaeon]|nr:60S ribosomal export protein NMD3 [Thermoplasmata archaeon]